jgi:hypothetical protein
MPEIPVGQSTFERLQRLARPFIDKAPEDVIVRALDELERATAPTAKESAPSGAVAGAERRIDLRSLPSLTHTKVLDAAIAGEVIARPNWNLLLDLMLRRAMKSAGSFEKLRPLCPVNMVKGRKEDEGYGHLADINVSVQGQDANGAARAIITAAQSLGIAVDIGFMWRHKDAAEYPGERARIQLGAAKGSKAT